MRWWRRSRPWVVGGGVLALVIGLLIATQGAGDPGHRLDVTSSPVELAAEPPLDTPPDTVETTPTTTETTSTTRSTVTTLRLPVPTVPTTTTTVAKPAIDERAEFEKRYGPLPPGSVVVPYRAGQRSWEGTSNGVRMSMTVNTGAPKAGVSIRFLIKLTSGDKPCCGVGLLFGDGHEYTKGNASIQCPGGREEPPGTRQFEFERPYNKVGRYRFLLQSTHTSCKPANGGALYGTIEIGAGLPPTTQGPWLPYFTYLGGNPLNSDSSGVQVIAEAFDDEGFVSRFAIQWGDASLLNTYPADAMECRRAESGWPLRSRGTTPVAEWPSHRYAAAGDYTVTVTVFSTGCDGTEVQQASKSFVWHASAPPDGASGPS